MGKSKELFMQSVQVTEDIEREYLVNGMIALSYSEEQYEKLKSSAEMNEVLTTKIIVEPYERSRIQLPSKEEQEYNTTSQIFGFGL